MSLTRAGTFARGIRLACCMTTIGIIGAGHIGGQVARAAIANGYEVVISNSRGPETLQASSANSASTRGRRRQRMPLRRAMSWS